MNEIEAEPKRIMRSETYFGITARVWWHVHTFNPDYCHGGTQNQKDATIYLETIREDFDHPDALLFARLFEPEECPHGADQPRFVLHEVVPSNDEPN